MPGKGRTILVFQERFAPCLALLRLLHGLGVQDFCYDLAARIAETENMLKHIGGQRPSVLQHTSCLSLGFAIPGD